MVNERDTFNIDKLLHLSFEDLMNVSVITATQNLQKSDEAPATVMVITGEQIRLRGYRNLAEILNDLPDFTVNDKSDPQFYNRVSLRGVSRQDYFVILLDGIRISSPTNEPLPLLENFPIQLARQIEVVYGPGSALYGADALAGVINIITQKATGTNDVSATAMGGTQGYSNVSAIFSKKLRNDIKLSLAGLYSYDGQPDFSKIYKDQYNMTSHQSGLFNSDYGPMMPADPVDPEFSAPIKAYNLYASIDKGGFSMKVLHHYVSVPTSTTLKPDNAVYNKDVFYGHGMTTASASYEVNTGKLKSVSSLVGSLYSVNPESNFRNLYGGMEHGYKYSTGSMMKVEEQLSYTFTNKFNLIGGLTYELFQSIPKTPELQNPVSRNGASSGILLNSIAENNPYGIEVKLYPLTYTNIGSYVQVQYSPASRISLIAGARYDYNSRFGLTINPRIGSVLRLFGTTTIKALYGTAFWAPSPIVSYESYGSFYTVDEGITYRSAYWHLPNPDLKPMTSQTVEISLQQKLGKNVNITLTAYQTEIDNVIQDVADTGNTNLYNNKFLGWDVDYIDVAFNKGSRKNYGGSLVANSTFKLGNLELMAYSSVSYVEGKEKNLQSSLEEVEQGAIIPLQFRAGLDGKLDCFHFSVRWLEAGKQRMTSFLQDQEYKRQTLPGYSLVNVSAGYTLKETTTFFVNIQNALNERYSNSLPWVSTDAKGSFQNPSRAILGVRLNF